MVSKLVRRIPRLGGVTQFLSVIALVLAGLGQASLAGVRLPRWLAAPYCFGAALLLLILATFRRQRDTATGFRRWLVPLAGLAGPCCAQPWQRTNSGRVEDSQPGCFSLG